VIDDSKSDAASSDSRADTETRRNSSRRRLTIDSRPAEATNGKESEESARLESTERDSIDTPENENEDKEMKRRERKAKKREKGEKEKEKEKEKEECESAD